VTARGARRPKSTNQEGLALTIAQRIGVLEKQFELSRQAGEFVSLCRILLASKGNIWQARQITDHVSPRLRALLQSDQIVDFLRSGGIQRGNPADQYMRVKAAVSALTLDSGSFATYELLVSGFANALSSSGVFDRLLAGGMRTIPLGRTIGAVTTAATAYVVGEGSAKQVSKLALTNGTLSPAKAHCIVAVANELLKIGGRDVDALLTRELINACVLAIDSAFLSILLTGVSVGTSSGQTAESVRADLAVLLAAVVTDQTSKLFVITTPAICKSWCAMGATATSGAVAFPDVGPQGGSILGIPVIASDAVTAGEVVLVDASAIAAGSDAVVISTMSEGSITPDTAPDSPQTASTNVVSLWQGDLSAILVERWWGASVLRSTAVAAISNANSYGQGFSPP
jgi:HK97 family phage major capsid protein